MNALTFRFHLARLPHEKMSAFRLRTTLGKSLISITINER